ncbi:DUF4386 domain-containing protein [Salipiger bermudensis]|uniref:DUF4386 domain-containing protein n=1 Tax=Salipiger bermudensis TaxID=344736 RepID=UPI001CD7EB47|nr:DUF4386 domain-containing protein [Salipiger bermudensis]MCA1285474.1 DUF4386 domain-containing protein [Salipiger bermudensis]
MTAQSPLAAPMGAARLAGALYLLIILLGLTSEVALRGSLIMPGDAVATAEAILAQPGTLRLSLAADTVMALADVALAVLLYLLLRPVSGALALMAMVFRLVQAALIAMSLLFQYGALLILQGDGAPEAAMLALELHGHGYDLGLVFFGVNSLLTGWLLVLSGFVPKLLGWLIAAAGVVYILGSAILFMAPAMADLFAPAYLLPVLSETAFCLWLLIRGLGPRAPG